MQRFQYVEEKKRVQKRVNYLCLWTRMHPFRRFRSFVFHGKIRPDGRRMSVLAGRRIGRIEQTFGSGR